VPTPTELQRDIQEFLRFLPADRPVAYDVHDAVALAGYSRLTISYAASDGDTIPAFLLVPDGEGPFPGLLLHHQHHGERHLGKSEVVGLAGDPLQAFGDVLARRGFLVLAPDAICFEDRRRHASGTVPHPEDTDQHYNEMCYRLVRGDTLMRKLLDDAAMGLSLLRRHPLVVPAQIGTCGHSFGGNTVLFHTALDPRIRFACASGAAGSYRYKLAHDVGLEMALVIPGFAARWDIDDLVRCIAPRPLLIASATDDPHAADAPEIIARARPAYARLDAADWLQHQHAEGQHALTPARFDAIVTWLVSLFT
jgi:dienelactone hydrolase